MNDDHVTSVSGEVPSPPKPSIEEVLAMRDSIMEGARRKVDPDAKGFDPKMSFAGWGWDWGERGLLRAFTLVEVCLLACSGTVGASIMFNSPEGARFAGPTLAVSAILGAWVVIAAAITQLRGR